MCPDSKKGALSKKLHELIATCEDGLEQFVKNPPSDLDKFSSQESTVRCLLFTVGELALLFPDSITPHIIAATQVPFKVSIH